MSRSKYNLKVFTLLSILISFLVFPACSSSKTGCPINEQAHVKADKRGKLPSSRGKSSVFPKDVKKKLGVK